MDRAMIGSPHLEEESFDSRYSNNHISPQNSKWFQQNMTDLETKVKEVVTLIEEDACSFNRKAEMYFRKRPVLMKLIEELYRAYRALAERYNYTNGELEWANRAMTKAFPTKVLFGLIEESSSSFSTNLYIEPNDVVTKENEVRNLNNALVTMRGEKEDVLLKYQKTMKKLSDLEEELNFAKMNSKGLSEQESEAKTEVQILKDAIAKVEVERDAVFLHQKDLIRRISILKPRISQVREVGLDEGASRAEIRTECLKNEVSKLETEKETSFYRYKMCLEKIADLEQRTSLAEQEAVLLHKRAHRAETEEKKLKNDLDELNREKKSSAIGYDHCLEKVSNLEKELSCAEDEMRRIRNEVLIDTEKLNSADDRCTMLENSNSSIKSEAAILKLNIAMKEKELSNKHEELEKLLARVQEERLRFVKVEAAILALQNFQSQEENGCLETREVVQILKEFGISQDGIGKEKETVNSLEDLQSGHFKLKGIKEKIEEEVVVQQGIANTLQEHINVLEEDIKGTKERYRSLMEKIKSLGWNPECVGQSIKALKDENSKLRQIYEENKEAKEALSNEFDKTEQLSKKNTAMEKSFQRLDEDKLALESQLRTIINYVEKLTEKNTVLENPLYVADFELESPKTKSENLEEHFESLENEKFDLVDERSKLVVSLDNVKNRLESLENKFSEAERKCIIMEKEREPTLAQVEEVKVSLGLEKRERSSLETSSEARLASLEKHLHFLQQEIKWSKIEFEEEVSRAVYSHFEIFILHITIQDIEMKNRSLLMECDRHIESSKLREDLVSELERENLEQQVEIELLISEIEKLRADIFHVFKTLGFSPGNKLENIIENIVGIKSSLSSYDDDKQKLLIENSILLTLLGQVSVEGTEIVNDKRILNKEFEKVTEQLMIEQNDKLEFIEMNTQLKSEIKKEKQNNEILKADIEKLCVHQRDMEMDYLNLKEAHCQTLKDNSSLMKNIIDLKNEKRVLEEENDSIIAETLVLGNKCTFFKNFVTEKDREIDSTYKELQNLRMVNGDLEKEVHLLKKRTEMEVMEKLSQKDLINKIEKEIHEVKDLNNQLRVGISDEMKIICQKEMEVCLAEEKFKATENLNSELRKNLEELRIELKETEITKEKAEKENIELFEENKNQGEEILFLREANENLSLEINEKKNEFQHLKNQFGHEILTKTVMLCQKDIESSLSEEDLKSKHEETIMVKKRLEKEIVELRKENENKNEEIRFLRETNENLNSELEEMKKECKVWEDEASAYFFSLQIFKACEVVLENKVRELSSICKTLGNESGSKSIEMEKMKERVESMESNIGCFKAQLSSYAPAIDSIQENMESLEHKVLGQPKLKADHKNESKDVTKPKNQVEEHIAAIPNRLEELYDLQTRIKSLEKVVTEGKKRVVTEDLKSSVEQDDEPIDGLVDTLKSQKINTELILRCEDVKQRRNDIYSPLQEEKESSVDKIEVPTITRELNLGMNNEKNLVEIDSNVQQLESLQKTVQDLKTKTEKNKKRKMKTVDLDVMKKQLTEVEQTLVHMAEINGPEENLFGSDTKALTKREFEKTKSLHLEIQMIQNMFPKLKNGNRTKGKIRFLKKTSIVVKSFFSYLEKRRTHTQEKKRHFQVLYTLE